MDFLIVDQNTQVSQDDEGWDDKLPSTDKDIFLDFTQHQKPSRNNQRRLKANKHQKLHKGYSYDY